jgi:hypothetical protein
MVARAVGPPYREHRSTVGLIGADPISPVTTREPIRQPTSLILMGRGKMMGVDHNKGLSCVGASAGSIADA